MNCKVYIILLNWNGWADTIECLESIFRLDYPDFHVVVCDNASTNNSVDKIIAWAEGRLNIFTLERNPLKDLSWPPVHKPLRYSLLQRKEAEKSTVCSNDDQLTIIQTGSNLGFAGGNNVGLRYIFTRGDYAFVWLLNNDTVIKKDSLTFMVRRIREKSSAGICGSTLKYYFKSYLIQAMGGGYYNRYFAVNRYIGMMRKTHLPLEAAEVERRMSYVAGASMLVTRQFLDRIGLMGEEYFLYFEELDWSERSKGQFTFAYAPESVVYHKEGSSAGTSSVSHNNSVVSDFFAISNRLTFTAKYYHRMLPFVYFGILISLVNRIRRRQLDKALMIARILFNNTRQRRHIMGILKGTDTV